MTSLADDRPLGVCVDVDCPVGQGSGDCRLNSDILHCINFEPDLDEEQPRVSEESCPDVQPKTEEPFPEADSVAAALVLSQGQGDVADLAQAKPAAFRPAPYAVEAPSGPRRKIDFSDNEIPVHSGLSLSADEANLVLGSTKAEIVMLVGLPNVGKTTFLAALYETLCVGPIEGILFGGSLSLLGFVEKAFFASTASGRPTPDTVRTSQDELSRPYLHLCLGSSDNGFSRDFLIADVSGEFFRDVASGGNAGDAAPLLKRANHIVHFVDAGEYGDPRQRQQAMAMTTARLRRLHESQAYRSDAIHTLVVSRSDLCDPEPLQELLDRLRSIAQKWASDARIVPVASRPASFVGPVGLGDVLYALTRERSPQNRHRHKVRVLNPMVSKLSSRHRTTRTSLPSRVADLIAGSFHVSFEGSRRSGDD
ncbi:MULTISPECIES: hypothetical protein [unclassified Micromonospora]|uniref:TRAFAC clade GTPase domain-containing protein n=1 Tax=unclassified Micromonospora TaxID=2617518 RepID=UPI003639B641